MDKKNKLPWFWIAITAGFCFLVSCSEFIEESVGDDRVQLLSPGMNAETVDYSLQFLWEPMDHALQYRLQLATPTFRAAEFFRADTVTEGTSFVISLPPGSYEWRVRALNGSSESDYTTRAFTIHEGALSRQTVLQVAPTDRLVTAQQRLTLSWQTLFNATRYVLQMDSNEFTDERKRVLEREVAGQSTVVELTEEGSYSWRVRAEHDTAQSRWSTIRHFIYDKTPPPVPVLIAPLDGAQVNRPATLQWNGATDASSYWVYVYKGDSTLVNERFPIKQTATTYGYGDGIRGERMLWRVKAVDKAGNESAYSTWRSFTIRN